MHGVMWRATAERARHAKRFDLEQLASPATSTTEQSATSATSLSSQAAPTASSTSPSSSSALSSSSASHSSSTSSSASSTSTSLTSSSSIVQSPTLPASSSSPTLSPSTILTSPTATSSGTPQANVAPVTNSGLSGGAIAGIIAGSVIVGVAIIVFFVRKTYLRRRENKRISWNAVPGLGADTPNEPKFPDISERLTNDLDPPHMNTPLSPFETHGQSMFSTPPVPPVVHMQAPALSTFAGPALPSATYNNPNMLATYPAHPVPSTYGVGNTTRFALGRVPSTFPSVRAQHAPTEAAVKCTFVPTLPDELSITTGERVFILEQYDDGWNMCANGRGERGMVPRDCLEYIPSEQLDISWRNMRRTSSLNPDGRRF